ncbi:hypothetical protein, partial [Advenella faeciporci]
MSGSKGCLFLGGEPPRQALPATPPQRGIFLLRGNSGVVAGFAGCWFPCSELTPKSWTPIQLLGVFSMTKYDLPFKIKLV